MSLHLVVGPMFSGKTSELQRLTRRHLLARRRVLVVKHAHDTRYSPDVDALTSFDGASMAARATDALVALVDSDDWRRADVIAIDEGQFYDDLVSVVECALDSAKIVIVAALNGTHERRPFGRVAELLPLADEITHLVAVCVHCGADAPFTRRTSDDRAELVIGGTDKYEAVCRTCYRKR